MPCNTQPTSWCVGMVAVPLNRAMIFSKLDANSGFWQISQIVKASQNFFSCHPQYREVRVLERQTCSHSKPAGHLPDPVKLKAILVIPPPTTVTELRRFMGMANQLGRFTPRLVITIAKIAQ